MAAQARTSDSDARQAGGGPRVDREKGPWGIQNSPNLIRTGLRCTTALQRPGQAVEGTGPEAVRWRLITHRSRAASPGGAGPRGSKHSRDVARLGRIPEVRCHHWIGKRLKSPVDLPRIPVQSGTRLNRKKGRTSL